MKAKLIFFLGTIVYVFVFILAAHDILLGKGEIIWQEWFVTSFTVLWLTFWTLWFYRSGK